MTNNPEPLLSLRNILVPTDFSETSARALGHALEIASRYQARLYLLHCVDPTPYNLGAPDAVETACEAAWRDLRQLESELCSKNPARNVEIKLLVESGDLATILPQVTADLAIDLIAVGTHGRTGWRKIALGSVAELIVRQASCPVLTVGPSDRGSPLPFGPKNILFANDLSGRSKLAESYGVSLARQWDSRLTVLNVVEDSSGSVSAHAAEVECCRGEWSDALVLEQEVTNSAQLTPQDGERSDVILRVAEQTSADLIVLPVFDAYRFADRFVSTYGYQVVCRSTCPVLTI